ncbi:MAG: hypothetical protein ACOYEJ_07600 [Mahellales bacterium]|jgi:hypothetical protein
MEERFSDSENDKQITAILATNIMNNDLFNEETDTYYNSSRSFPQTQYNLLFTAAIVFIVSMLLNNGRQAHMLKDTKQDPCPLNEQTKNIKETMQNHKNTKVESRQNTGQLILVKEKSELKNLLASLRVHLNTREQYIIDLLIKIFELDDNLRTIKEYRSRESTDALSGFAYTREQSVGILRTLQSYLPPRAKTMAEETLKLIEVIDSFRNYTKKINTMEDDNISLAEKGRELIKVFKPILNEKLKKNIDKMIKMLALIEMMNEQEFKNRVEKEEGSTNGQPHKTTDTIKALPTIREKAEPDRDHDNMADISAQEPEDNAIDDNIAQYNDDNNLNGDAEGSDREDDTSQNNNEIDDGKGDVENKDGGENIQKYANNEKNGNNDNMLDSVRNLLNDESQREKLSKFMEIAKYMAKSGE